MSFKLISTVAAASLAVFLMVDAGSAYAAEGCSFGDRDSVFGGGCRTSYRETDRQDYAPVNPRRGYTVVEDENEVEEGENQWGRDRKKRHDKHRHYRRHDRHQRYGHRGWRDRELDLERADLRSLVEGGFRTGYRVGNHVAKNGLEDRIDPAIVESLRNGELSKTAFGKGVEKGYLAGKNGDGDRKGRGYKGQRGHKKHGYHGRKGKKGHWGKKGRKGHMNGHKDGRGYNKGHKKGDWGRKDRNGHGKGKNGYKDKKGHKKGHHGRKDKKDYNDKKGHKHGHRSDRDRKGKKDRHDRRDRDDRRNR